MTMLSILLSLFAVVLAWFKAGPAWLPLATASVAAVVAFARTVAALRANNWKDWSLRALVLALVVLMALPSITLRRPREVPASSVATAPAASTISATPVPASSSAQSSEPLAALPPMDDPSAKGDPIERAEAARRKLAPERWQWAAAVAALGPGHEPAFAFVRDRVGVDPYKGVLRGAVGTFLARRGNSWDRALLLQALLEDKGIEARLARGVLDGATAARLFARAFTRPQSGAPSSVSQPAAVDPLVARVQARASRDFRAIRTALGGTLSQDPSSRTRALDELCDHVWVQAHIDGTWLDLDPTYPESTPGVRIVQAKATFKSPPADMHQRVTIRVVAETITGTRVTERVALKFTDRAASLLSRQIFLSHTQGQGVGGMIGRVSGERWAPVLIVDGQIIAGQPIAFGAGDDVGAFFGGNETEVVSEWLEVAVQIPGADPDVSRRTLVSRASAQARAAGRITRDELAPLARNDRGALAAQALHVIWLSAGSHNLIGYTDAVMALARALKPDGDGKVAPPPTSGDALWAIGVGTFPFLVWSDHHVIPALDKDPSVRVYADSPRVIVITTRPDGRDDARVVTDVDLLRDHIRAVAAAPAADSAANEKRTWFGVLEGALEHELGASAVADAGGTPEDLLSTSGLLGAAGVERLGPSDAAKAETIAGSGERAARLTAALARNSSVIVPTPDAGRPARGWWEIGADGSARAVIDGGLGGTSYSRGSGPLLRYSRTGSGSGPGGVWEVNPRTGADVGRLRSDGSWERFGSRAASRGGGNEYSILTTVIGVIAFVSFLGVGVAVYHCMSTAQRTIEALPTESTQ
jgi:transglutaminase-like putative cysteine protease